MSLQNELVETIKNNELQSVTAEIAETIIDSALNEGMFRDIPLIGTIIGITKGLISIQDRLFTKKLLSFLFELRDIPTEQRNEQILKIESSDKYGKNVGEKLLFIIEKTSDSQKASMIGKLFANFLTEEISYNDFIRCSEIMNKSSIHSLIDFINGDFTAVPIDDEDDFINSGLFIIEEPKIELVKINVTKSEFGVDVDEVEYRVKGIFWSALVSKNGKIIRKYLKEV
jgi:hypothetical protein